MAIKVKCDSCKKVINAPEKFAGKKTKCPGCKSPIVIPELEAAPEEVAPVEVDAPVEPEPTPEAEETAEVAPKAKKGKGKLGGGKLGGKGKGKSKLGGGPKGKSKLGKSGSIKKSRTKPVAASKKTEPEDDEEDDGEQDSPKSNKMLFIMIGAAVLLIALGAGGYFFFMNEETPTSSKAVASNNKKASATTSLSALDIIPVESAGLGGFNIQKLLSIPMLVEEIEKNQKPEEMEKFFADLEDNETTQKLREEIEADGTVAAIKKRFDKVTLAFEAPEDLNATKPDQKGMVILNTSMDSYELLESILKMMKKKIELTPLEGAFKGYEFEEDGQKGQVSSLDSSLLALGSFESMEKAKKLASEPDESASIKSNSDLLANSAKYQDDIFWFAFMNPNDAPEAKEEADAPAPGAMQMPFGGNDIKSSIFSIDYEDDTLSVYLDLEFFDESKVQAANMMVAGFAPMGLGMVGIAPQQLKVIPEGSRLTATLDLTAEMLKQISEKAEQMTKGAMPPAQP